MCTVKCAVYSMQCVVVQCEVCSVQCVSVYLQYVVYLINLLVVACNRNNKVETVHMKPQYRCNIVINCCFPL